MSPALARRWRALRAAIEHLERHGWHVDGFNVSSSQDYPLVNARPIGAAALPNARTITTRRKRRADGQLVTYLETAVCGCRVTWRAD